METMPLNEGQTAASYQSAENESAFICNICLEITNKDPVVTQCGHLYCWPCLYRWLNTQQTPCCPVCKAGVSRDNVIPLFIRGSVEDPRSKRQEGEESVPNRPIGHRPEPQQQTAGGGMNNINRQLIAQFGGMSFSAGFGFFPSLFGLQFQNFAPPIPPPPTDGSRAPTRDENDQALLSSVLIALGIVVILGLIFF
mmetsp:Transcript_5393/g.5531  ORF Transcript_5393/g.5531 Transcript_5393/m.5531 type:complete len:196 (+) Transcript_5393:110-697(+)